MLLNKLDGFLAATLMATAALAQQPAVNPQPPAPEWFHMIPPPNGTVTYASAADVAALIARAKQESKSNSLEVEGNILQLAPYKAAIEYRPAGESVHFPAAIHPKQAELLYLLEGAGTFITGGTLGADHMKGIVGGEPKKVSKGDFIFIPEGTPHWFSHVDRSIVLVSVFMPRPVPTQ